MATIEKHPDVADYVFSMTLDEIRDRGGVADLVEDGNLVLVQDYRMDFDFEAIAKLEKSLESVKDEPIRRKLKKLSATQFFEGEPPKRTLLGGLKFAEPIRQALFDTMCRRDLALFDRAKATLERSHEESQRIFDIAFPGYDAYRLIPSLRLTQTLFENLHWDDHGIDDDFHQARVFANLDLRPRIWNISHRFIDFAEALYEEHDLSRFAGRNPNEMVNYINGKVLGGMGKKWLDTLPRHRVAFDPGEVWLGESRLISHQIFYGEAAMVYMWFVRAASMSNPANRFNARIEDLHRRMATNRPTPQALAASCD